MRVCYADQRYVGAVQPECQMVGRELMSAQGTQKLVSSMQELELGGKARLRTVNSVKNSKVVLALGNGQTITARLDGKVSIQPGESMFSGSFE